jgi:hypothetical protein
MSNSSSAVQTMAWFMAVPSHHACSQAVAKVVVQRTPALDRVHDDDAGSIRITAVDTLAAYLPPGRSEREYRRCGEAYCWAYCRPEWQIRGQEMRL